MASAEVVAVAVVAVVDWANAIPPLFNALHWILARMEEVKHTTTTTASDHGSFRRIRSTGAIRRDLPLDFPPGS
jgi:hypothetical protein